MNIESKSGYLKLVIGPMYSSKSTDAISHYNRFKKIGVEPLVINHEQDVRYGKGIIASHDGQQIQAIMLENLKDIFLRDETYKKHRIIIIEEGQFFSDLKEIVSYMVNRDHKIVIVFGLSGDSERKKFGQIADLISEADKIEQVKALCVKCKDGTPAPFTKSIVKKTSQILIGGVESYIPVCRYHHLQDE